MIRLCSYIVVAYKLKVLKYAMQSYNIREIAILLLCYCKAFECMAE